MKKINVYGGTGFIGSKFCQLFGDEVVIQERNNNYPTTKDILYLISTTDNYNVLTDLQIDIDTNLKKLMAVLQHCKDNNITFNFVSSWFVYGNCKLPACETDICDPRGFYSITKKTAEDMLISFCKTFGVKYRILRLCNVYGPGDNGKSKKKNALQYLVDEIKANRNINLYHGGRFVRDYMHVEDVCRAIKLCIEQAPLNEIINIGSGIRYEFLELMKFVADQTNYSGTFINIEPTEFHKIVQVKDFYMDVTKLKSLGFKQQISIEDGLKQLL